MPESNKEYLDDMKTISSKFTETSVLKKLVRKYGLPEGGRQKMVDALYIHLAGEIRKVAAPSVVKVP